MFENLTMIWTVWDFLQSPAAVGIFAALFGLSEALAAIPQIASNSVFQAVKNGLKNLAKR